MDNKRGSTRGTSKERHFNTKLFGGIAAVVILAGGAGFVAYKMGAFDNVSFSNNVDNQNKYATVMATIPLDEKQLAATTFPWTHRDIFWSIPSDSKPFSIAQDGSNQTNLTLVTDSYENGINVKNYQTSDGTIPSGIIGVQDDYADFLTEAAKRKNDIEAGKSRYTSELEHADKEVKGLYVVKSGYDLYCKSEDSEIAESAKYAYDFSTNNKEDGRKMYYIPEDKANNFIGVTTETCDMIDKYEILYDQILDVYDRYTGEGMENGQTLARVK